LLLGLGDRQGGGAHGVGQSRLRVHLRHDLVHVVEVAVVGGDDQVQARVEDVELGVGDQHRDLDELVLDEVEPRHLAVDPDQVPAVLRHVARQYAPPAPGAPRDAARRTRVGHARGPVGSGAVRR
jgi:hypothetical protein